MNETKKIAVIGCGKVGKAFAAFMLARGHKVYLHDISVKVATGAYMDLCFMGRVRVGFSSDTIDLIFLSARPYQLDDGSYDLKTCVDMIEMIINGKKETPIFVFSNPVKEMSEALSKTGFTRVIPSDCSLDVARLGSNEGMKYVNENIHASQKNTLLNNVRDSWLGTQERAYETPSVYNAVHFAIKQMEKERLI